MYYSYAEIEYVATSFSPVRTDLAVKLLSALEMLGLSCRLLIFLMGRRISSMVMVLSLKSNTAPISCKVLFAND